jgi:hypothetical protein
MIQLKACEICGKNVLHPDFLIDPQDCSPKYFASIRFNSDLKTDVIFCGAEHSFQWHEKRRLTQKD